MDWKAKPFDRTAPWYNALTEPEAREVDALEGIINNCKAALKTASERRWFIQRRATVRKAARRTDGQDDV